MNILLIGSGGREHAIAYKLAESPNVETVYCAPGNGGTYYENKCKNIPMASFEELAGFAKDNDVELTIVGPEDPLTHGIVDIFKSKGLKILGPSAEAAKLEGSKIFAKNFMKKYGIKTAAYECFYDLNTAMNYINSCEYPIVIKADGLAAGKGVVITSDPKEAEATIKEFMVNDIFNGSGKKIVIEEYLDGVEASILSITDGETILPFISAKDHKQIFDENKGPNTGGMGAIAPNPYCSQEVLKAFNEDILLPTLNGIKSEKFDYKGIIFFGLMITKKGVYLLEYNVRLGDPETQAVLPIMESDFLELVKSALDGNLKSFDLKWKKAHSCCIVAASKGYPGNYEKGLPISIKALEDGKVFSAGVSLNEEKAIITSGGRVLSVVSTGDDLSDAIKKAYSNIKFVNFDGMYYRKDIGTLY